MSSSTRTPGTRSSSSSSSWSRRGDRRARRTDRQHHLQRSNDFKAVFSDATGVNKGDDIRIAGVKVGSVKTSSQRPHPGAGHLQRRRRLIVTESSTATIRYRNLVGQRYISLTQGIGDTRPAADELHHPDGADRARARPLRAVQRLQAAVRSTVPGGHQQALVRGDLGVPGRGRHLRGLLQHTASMTNTLADRDEVIGEPIDNLNVVLETRRGSRPAAQRSLITQFQRFIAGLRRTRTRSSARSTGLHLADRDLRPGHRHPPAVRQGRQGAAPGRRQPRTRTRREIDRALQILPIKLNKIGRTAIYGSFFNFYLCDFHGNVDAAHRPATIPVDYNSRLDRREVQPRMSTPSARGTRSSIGAVSLAVIALLILAAFKADDLPLIGGGDTYHADFTEAGGLKPNDEVRVAGVRVGKVDDIELDGDQVQVTFMVDTGAEVRQRDRRRDQGQDPARLDVPRARARRHRPARARTPTIPVAAHHLAVRRRGGVLRPGQTRRAHQHRQLAKSLTRWPT